MANAVAKLPWLNAVDNIPKVPYKKLSYLTAIDKKQERLRALSKHRIQSNYRVRFFHSANSREVVCNIARSSSRNTTSGKRYCFWIKTLIFSPLLYLSKTKKAFVCKKEFGRTRIIYTQKKKFLQTSALQRVFNAARYFVVLDFKIALARF